MAAFALCVCPAKYQTYFFILTNQIHRKYSMHEFVFLFYYNGMLFDKSSRHSLSHIGDLIGVIYNYWNNWDNHNINKHTSVHVHMLIHSHIYI